VEHPYKSLPPNPRVECFKPAELNEALKFAESLRAKRREGQPISHVSLQSEMPESVGQAGVSDADPDYDWYKRRINPQTKLGREEK
jgi:hypothetical protein